MLKSFTKYFLLANRLRAEITNAPISAYMHKRIHTQPYAHRQTHTPTHIHTHTYTHARRLSTQTQAATHTHTDTHTPTHTPTHTQDLTFTAHDNGVVHINLNRPKSLNAISYDMVISLISFLQQKHKDKTCNAIFLTGEGEKAFCAGGDIRALKALGEKSISRFFKIEYQMNYWTNYISVPYVSIWRGIVMGGGVGISVHGDYRVATNSTMFAMPETAIGLFPDIGSSYFLSHMERPLIGLYLGLTGARLNGADVLNLKLATHYIEDQNIPVVMKKIAACNFSREDKYEVVEKVLREESSVPKIEPSITEELLQKIESHLSQCNSLNDYLELLEKDKSTDPFAADVLKKLQGLCPISCAVWWEAFHRGKSLNLKQAFEMEYALVRAMVLDTPNFKEGVDAMLVRKCKQPDWKPKLFSELDPQRIRKLFTRRPLEPLFEEL